MKEIVAEYKDILYNYYAKLAQESYDKLLSYLTNGDGENAAKRG